jgi:hypothetical protein
MSQKGFSNQAIKDAWDAKEIIASSSWNTYTGLSTQGANDALPRFQSFDQHVCHGKLSKIGGYMGQYSNVKVVWSRKAPNQDGATKELEDIYYPWLLNDSPWAAAFIEKNYSKCLKHGFSLDASLPHSYVASALVATRWLTEKYQSWTTDRYPLYKKLLAGKEDPLWAFIMANLYYSPTKERYSFSMPTGHEMLPPTMSLETLGNFVHGRYADQPSFAENRGYSGIGITWGKTDVPEGVMLKTLAKNWTVKKDTKVDLNVFRRPDPKSGYPQLTYEELLIVMRNIQEMVYAKKAA